ncbi:hypothetical protein D3C72_2532360 [compost metagenome]
MRPKQLAHDGNISAIEPERDPVEAIDDAERAGTDDEERHGGSFERLADRRQASN